MPHHFWFWFGVIWIFCGVITFIRSLRKDYGILGSFIFSVLGPILWIVVIFFWVKDKIEFAKYKKKQKRPA